MKALVRNWLSLHEGDTPGSPCDCTCNLCKNGACTDFLGCTSEKDVVGIGRLCDRLLCEKVAIYCTDKGHEVAAHRDACEIGGCHKCQRKKDMFFGCPKHSNGDEAEGVGRDGSHVRDKICQWEAFARVDEDGNDAELSPNIVGGVLITCPAVPRRGGWRLRVYPNGW